MRNILDIIISEGIYDVVMGSEKLARRWFVTVTTVANGARIENARELDRA